MISLFNLRIAFGLVLALSLGLGLPEFANGAEASAPVAAPSATAAAVAPAAPPPRDVRLVSITRVVGEVDDHVVTSREVRIEDAVSQALSGKANAPEGFRILTGAEKGFPGEVSNVLEDWMIYLEAKTLSSQPPSRTEVTRGIGSVQEKWGSNAAWNSLEVGTDELRQIVERQLVVRAFEQLRSDPQLIPVSDDDALTFYKKNRLRFGSLPFSAFKENIKTYLVKQQTEKRMADWHDSLRRKYKVRNYISG